MVSLFTLKEILQIAVGLMLMAFGLISVSMGDITIAMVGPIIGFFALGGYLTYRGIKQYLARNLENQTVDSPQVTSQIREPQLVATGKFCTNCGEKITEGSKFCTNCGQKFNLT